MDTKENNKSRVILVGVIIGVLVGALCMYLAILYVPGFGGKTITNVTKTEKEVTVTDNGIADAVEKVYDSVVIVETFAKGRAFATGTGFIYKHSNDTYYILTNHHVIEDGDQIKIVLTNGDEVEVKVEGGDEFSDIAVLSYKTDKELKVSNIGSSTNARVGDTVFAIGAPLDSSVYSWTVTRGVLSGKDREVSISLGGSQTSETDLTVPSYMALWYVADAGWNCGEIVSVSNVNATENSYTINRESIGSNTWSTQMFYKENAGTYNVSFKITSSAAGDITINTENINLSANTAYEYSKEIALENFATLLSIQLGGTAGILPAGTFTISDFSVTAK